MELLIISLSLIILALLISFFADKREIQKLNDNNRMLQAEVFKKIRTTNLKKEKYVVTKRIGRREKTK